MTACTRPDCLVADFIARWVSDRKLTVDPGLVSLRLVPYTGEEVPTPEKEASAVVLQPRKTLAQAGVGDGSWLVAVFADAPSRGVRLLSVEALQLARRCVFTVALSRRGAAVGVGVFFKPGGAVTANHNFPDTARVGQVVYGVVHDVSGGGHTVTTTDAPGTYLDGQHTLSLEAELHHVGTQPVHRQHHLIDLQGLAIARNVQLFSHTHDVAAWMQRADDATHALPGLVL